MPNKLKFHIVFCSSEDESHPITEWYVHNPNSRGWQTPRGYEIIMKYKIILLIIKEINFVYLYYSFLFTFSAHVAAHAYICCLQQ